MEWFAMRVPVGIEGPTIVPEARSPSEWKNPCSSGVSGLVTRMVTRDTSDVKGPFRAAHA